MNKRIIGALTMVLVGSVTFSVTNTLLSDQSIKPSTQINHLPLSDDQKTDDSNSPKEKTAMVQAQKTVGQEVSQVKYTVEAPVLAPTTDRKDVDTTVSHKIVHLGAINKNSKTTAPIQTNATKITVASSTAKTPTPVTNISTNQKPTISGTTSTKTSTTTLPKSSQSTSTTKTTTTTTTTTTNHGKQVSQAAREKAASRKDQIENTGKKK
ncbi:hypothetical protein [Neobacillus vireti]|uniref:hypothetical protein n=1 Tax=Neobacillus vireti TaxID=220686 RepID=UPI002FFFD2BA